MTNHGRPVILTYHSLDDSGSVISIPPALFRRQMGFLAASGIPVVPLDRVMHTPGSVALTFDDGFRNFAEVAVPVLARFHLTATLFVVSRYCGRTNDWPASSRIRVPRLPLLSWEELRALPPLISVGAHTATHPDLTRIPPAQCDREMTECHTEMEQRLGKPASWLAYPFGAASPAVRSLAARRFELAVGTALGFVSAGSDVFELPRIDTYYLRGLFPMERLFSRAGLCYIAARWPLRKARRGFRPSAISSRE